MIAYDREHEKWPREQRISIQPRYCEAVAREVARRCGVRLCGVRLDLRRGGRYRGLALCEAGVIRLRPEGASLGVIVHEVAHLLNWQRWRGRGHRGTYGDALGLAYSVVRTSMRSVLVSAKWAADAELALSRMAAERETKKAVAAAKRVADRRAKLSSREYRVGRLRDREKRLATRVRRLTTNLESVRRSLKAYERQELNRNFRELAEEAAAMVRRAKSLEEAT